jgi:hypothetical protein
MATIAEMIEAAKRCCRKNIGPDSDENRRFYERLFGENWEAFVIKYDKNAGVLTVKLACCALSPV